MATQGKETPARLRRRQAVHVTQSAGDQAADAVAAKMGSWTFVIVQTTIVAVWIALNLVAFIAHWDPYPFILLNLLFSTQAAYTAPIIMMSQNRQAEKDRRRDDHEADEVSLLYTINQQQLQILELLQQQICAEEVIAASVAAHAGDAGKAEKDAAPRP